MNKYIDRVGNQDAQCRRRDIYEKKVIFQLY